MPGQKQISAFFKPLATATPKRPLSSEDAGKSLKKAKCGTTSDDGLFSCANDIEKKRLMAKIKLQSRATPIVPADVGLTWFAALEPEFSKDYFVKLSNFVQEERKRHTVYPSHENVFTWTKACEVKKVKVIILGQDPYHNPGQAHGLAFSVPKGVAIPMSLLNMYKELAADIPGFQQPSHGNLTGWAEQGVLLLNACLTVRMNQPNSHKDQGWENLTDAVIRHLNRQCNNLVFLLWGAYAQKKGSIIDRGPLAGSPLKSCASSRVPSTTVLLPSGAGRTVLHGLFKGGPTVEACSCPLPRTLQTSCLDDTWSPATAIRSTWSCSVPIHLHCQPPGGFLAVATFPKPMTI